ncbi:hypothetical protein ACFYT4_31950 [Streptomyces sp. NPDC004609]|uniref:hypothetical protein n=1 Tax=Streptomyces sp. NPDC004609 TaxID=3364704 RepID=UPI00368F874E
MTENEPQELSPEAQREQDLARVQTQLGVTDLTQKVTSIVGGLFGSPGPGPFARTSFEAHELNAMIDLVENSNPADLENAGTALWKARDALRSAAKELQDYVDKVEWKGESGNEFRSFGRALADHARTLGSFADVAGTQITVAGTGLASVRKAMPPRDTRVKKQDVNTIEAPKRVEGNPEYDEAVKVEKNRQEAINQMTRLASFYAVSEETLAGQEAPRFDRILKAEVPPPLGGREKLPAERSRSNTLSGERAPHSVSEHRSDPRSTADAPRTEITGTAPTAPDRNTSMEIDSVAAPPSVPTTPNAAPTVPTSTGPGGPVPPMGGMTNPVPNTAGPAGRAPGVFKAGGGPGVGAVGRSGAGGGGFPAAGHAGAAGRGGVVGGGSGAAGGTGAAGRSTGPMGAGSAVGGRAGGVTGGTAGQSPMAGRAGMAGQPMAGRAGRGTAPGSRTGRADGIVGGTPQRTTGGTTGSRIPRGTVVGGEGAASGRPSTARPSQAGVVGANPAGTPQRPVGRGTPSTNGVVGTPRTGGSGSRPGTGGFTAGGAGLAGGRPRQNQSGDREDEDTGSTRPDYLTEDEETWAARRRGAVPPVIE